MTYEQKIQRITGCLRDSRYLDNDRAARVSRLTDMMYDAYSRKGQNAGNAEALAESLDREIADYMGYQLTFSEACLAIEWGLHGEYGEYTGLNVERLFRFVRSYLESEERQQALKMSRSSGVPAHGLTRDEIQRRNWDAMLSYVRRAWTEFRSGSEGCAGSGPYAEDLEVAAAHNRANAYQWLKDQGLIARDSDTMATEAGMLKEACRRLRADSGSGAVKSLSGSLLLALYFRTAESAGLDLGAELDRIGRETPDDERRFWE